MEPVPPPEIDGLRYVSTISTGANAAVHVYRDQIGRQLAVKVFVASAQQSADTELRALTALGEHPNVAEVYGYGQTRDGLPYLVTRLYPGRLDNYRDVLSGSGGLLAGVLRVGVLIAGALATAHARGILHRDVKPSNILFTGYGQPVLIDFDIARYIDQAEEVFAPLSEPWSAPEVRSGASNGSPKSDVYSLAATLWTVVTGRPPSPNSEDRRANRERLRRALRSDPTRLQADQHGLAEFEQILASALTLTESERPDALAFARGLNLIELSLGRYPTQPIVDIGFPRSQGTEESGRGAQPTDATRSRPPAPPTSAPLPPPSDAGYPTAPSTTQPPPFSGETVRRPTRDSSQYPVGASLPGSPPTPPPSRRRTVWPRLGLPRLPQQPPRRGRSTRNGRVLEDRRPRVNTGFERRSLLGRRTVRPTAPLRPNRSYDFWLEIGAPVKRSIETATSRLPVEDLPIKAVLDVVVFSLNGGVEVAGSTQRQQLILNPDGFATRPGSRNRRLWARSNRLQFRVRMPNEAKIASLRCSIYHEQVLLQSRVVRVRVERGARYREDALRAEVDYSVAPNLDSAYVKTLTPHTVSIFMNDDAAGSHGFYFCGSNSFTRTASIPEHDLDDLCAQARAALRRTSWGSVEEWTPRDVYRYGDKPVSEELLIEDLGDLARAGARLWDKLAPHASGSTLTSQPGEVESDFRALMRAPGRIQLVRRVDLDLVVPAALVYDYPLDDPLQNPRICQNSLAAVKNVPPDDLVDHPCFRGQCPSYDDLGVVCVGGFWGFRHEIGLPISLGSDTAGVPPTEWIDYSTAGPTITTGFSSDATLIRRVVHREQLRLLHSPVDWFTTEQAHELVDLCKRTEPHLVYLLCHGGVTSDNTAFLEVGAPGGEYLTPHTFRRHQINWRRTRPLVMLNGCNTAALTPTRQLEFVNTLVRYCAAAGVIGTEVTVFEDLACDFAEEFLRRVLTQRQPLGLALRGARLAILANGNPLGLAYTAHASAGVTYRAS